jgi:hypothetical protein
VETLPAACVDCDHDPGLPDRDLRLHVLAAALRAAERLLATHGYADVSRSMEVLHVALEDADELPDERPN